MTAENRHSAGHWLGVVMLTAGAVLIIRAAMIGDPGLRVPPLIAYACAGVFLVGAFALLQQIFGGPTRGHGAAVLILAGLTVIGAWIALSPSSGGCTIGLNEAGTQASGLMCRIPFGIGALLTGLATFAAGRSWIRARRPTTASSSAANKSRF